MLYYGCHSEKNAVCPLELPGATRSAAYGILGQKELKNIIFPLGEIQKKEVRKKKCEGDKVENEIEEDEKIKQKRRGDKINTKIKNQKKQ